MAALRSVGARRQMGPAPLGGNGEAAVGWKQADVGTSEGLAGHGYHVNNQVAKMSARRSGEQERVGVWEWVSGGVVGSAENSLIYWG